MKKPDLNEKTLKRLEIDSTHMHAYADRMNGLCSTMYETTLLFMQLAMDGFFIYNFLAGLKQSAGAQISRFWSSRRTFFCSGRILTSITIAIFLSPHVSKAKKYRYS